MHKWGGRIEMTEEEKQTALEALERNGEIFESSQKEQSICHAEFSTNQATIRAALSAQENLFLEHYNKGVSDTKKAISDKIEEMALYFDKWECYSGKYSSASARESVTPEELGVIITELDVEPNSALTAPDVNEELLVALKECLPRIEEIRLVDLSAVREAEMQDYNEIKILTRRELAETNELINKINKAIARAEAQKAAGE